MELELNDREREQLTSIETGHSFLSLASDWRTFVVEVENGYKLTIYNFHDDLDCRKLLQGLAVRADEQLREKLGDWLKYWDNRFYAATYDSKECVWVSESREKEPWCYRIPKKLIGELEEDMRSMGLLD